MNIAQLLETGGVFTTDNRMNSQQNMNDRLVRIFRDANFAGKLFVGNDVTIETAKLGAGCVVEDRARIFSGAVLGDEVTVERDSELCRDVTVLGGSILGQKSHIGERSVIGNNVNLPAEARLGADVIIPNTRTIVTLGRFGVWERPVTIHGGPEGPQYSINWQASVGWEDISKSLKTNEDPLETNAHYRQYLDVFNAIGAQVQAEYDASGGQIEELKEQGKKFHPTASL